MAMCNGVSPMTANRWAFSCFRAKFVAFEHLLVVSKWFVEPFWSWWLRKDVWWKSWWLIATGRPETSSKVVFGIRMAIVELQKSILINNDRVEEKEKKRENDGNSAFLVYTHDRFWWTINDSRREISSSSINFQIRSIDFHLDAKLKWSMNNFDLFDLSMNIQ